MEMSESNIIEEHESGPFLSYVDGSPHIVIIEIPILGKLFTIGKLVYDTELSNIYEKIEGADSEFFRILYSSDADEEDMSDIAKYRFKRIKTKSGLKFLFGKWKSYYILKEGIINEKSNNVVNHQQMLISFNTRYTYHLINPVKFLEIYKNRKKTNPATQVWDIMQNDIRLKLDKEIGQYIVNSEIGGLTNYNKLRFEKQLMHIKLSIIEEYGIYIDEAHITNLILPKIVTDESAELEGQAQREQRQLRAAQVEADKAVIKESGHIAAACYGAEQLGGMSVYLDFLRARNSKVHINTGIPNNSSSSPKGLSASNVATSTNVGESTIPGSNPQKGNTLGSQPEEKRMDIILWLIQEEICNDYGDLNINIIRKALKTNNIPRNANELTMEEYFKIVNYMGEEYYNDQSGYTPHK